MHISDRMADVLGLEDSARDDNGLHLDGNIAARLVNAVEHGGNGLGGIGLGWADMEASTDFLTSIVSAVDDGETDAFGIADYAVPIYTADRLYAVQELGLTSETSEFATADTSLGELAGYVLYEYGAMLADGLIALLDGWDDDDADDDDG
jgi:hypothetical protein